MNIGANGKVVLTATRELHRKWEATREQWRDQKAAQFEKEYLADIFATVERCMPVFEELERVIGNVRNRAE